MNVTMRDIRAAGYCSRGARLFAAKHGIDWSKFLSEGVPEEDLANIDDEMLRRVLRIKNE